MTPPATGPIFVLALLPHEVDALRVGKRVTRSYPDQIPYGLGPFTAEDLQAMKDGKHVIQMSTPEHPRASRFLQVGDVFRVDTSARRPPTPPPLSSSELESLKAGKTVAKTVVRDARPLPPDFGSLVTAKVVEYRVQGGEHIYTLEAA